MLQASWNVGVQNVTNFLLYTVACMYGIKRGLTFSSFIVFVIIFGLQEG